MVIDVFFSLDLILVGVAIRIATVRKKTDRVLYIKFALKKYFRNI